MPTETEVKEFFFESSLYFLYHPPGNFPEHIVPGWKFSATCNNVFSSVITFTSHLDGETVRFISDRTICYKEAVIWLMRREDWYLNVSKAIVAYLQAEACHKAYKTNEFIAGRGVNRYSLDQYFYRNYPKEDSFAQFSAEETVRHLDSAKSIDKLLAYSRTWGQAWEELT